MSTSTACRLMQLNNWTPQLIYRNSVELGSPLAADYWITNSSHNQASTPNFSCKLKPLSASRIRISRFKVITSSISLSRLISVQQAFPRLLLPHHLLQLYRPLLTRQRWKMFKCSLMMIRLLICCWNPPTPTPEIAPAVLAQLGKIQSHLSSAPSCPITISRQRQVSNSLSFSLLRWWRWFKRVNNPLITKCWRRVRRPTSTTWLTQKSISNNHHSCRNSQNRHNNINNMVWLQTKPWWQR